MTTFYRNLIQHFCVYIVLFVCNSVSALGWIEEIVLTFTLQFLIIYISKFIPPMSWFWYISVKLRLIRASKLFWKSIISLCCLNLLSKISVVPIFIWLWFNINLWLLGDIILIRDFWRSDLLWYWTYGSSVSKNFVFSSYFTTLSILYRNISGMTVHIRTIL